MDKAWEDVWRSGIRKDKQVFHLYTSSRPASALVSCSFPCDIIAFLIVEEFSFRVRLVRYES